MTPAPDPRLRSGDAAPNFHLPSVNREGILSLDDYRGRTAVMVGLFRGLHCPFCRRHIARLDLARDKLAQEGVATVAVVNTQLERARQYFQYHPTRIDLATIRMCRRTVRSASRSWSCCPILPSHASYSGRKPAPWRS
jgi:hypothetical protein